MNESSQCIYPRPSILNFFYRFALEFGYAIPACGDAMDSPRAPPAWWYTWIGNVHYLHFGVLLFGISGIVAIAVSYMTPPIAEEHLYRLTFWTRHSTQVRLDLDEDTQYNTAEKSGNVSFKAHLFFYFHGAVFLSRNDREGKGPRSGRISTRAFQIKAVSIGGVH